MNPGIATAEDLFAAMKKMPPTERVRFFTLLGETAFKEDHFSHAEVFGDILDAEFTVEEAAEYLEISVSTFRRYVQGKKIYVHLKGACSGCMMEAATLGGIQQKMIETLGELVQVLPASHMPVEA